VNHLVVLVVAAFGSVGITAALRAVPPFSAWNETGLKPWGCDLCMSLWGAALCLIIGSVAGRVSPLDAFFLWMPAFAMSYVIVQRLTPAPLGEPPIDPPSPSEDK